MTDIASIRRKIAALLAKAKGTDNVNEAMAFAAKAQQLLREHNLTEADVDPDRPGRTRHVRVATWRATVAAAAAHLFDVHVYREADQVVVFVGPEGNRVTATLMHDYFIASIRRAKREFIKAHRAFVLAAAEAQGFDRMASSVQAAADRAVRAATVRAAFERGMANELHRRVAAAHTQSQAALDKAALALPGGLVAARGRRVRVGAGYGAGAEAASRVGLTRQAVGGAALQLGAC